MLMAVMEEGLRRVCTHSRCSDTHGILTPVGFRDINDLSRGATLKTHLKDDK